MYTLRLIRCNSCRSISSGFERGASISSLYPFPYFILKCRAIPMHCNLPLTRIPMRSPMASASSIEWVVMITDWSARLDPVKFHSARLNALSTPVVGSSNNLLILALVEKPNVTAGNHQMNNYIRNISVYISNQFKYEKTDEIQNPINSYPYKVA